MHASPADRWTTGYTQGELDGAQERYSLRFPPDLIDLFLDRRLVQGYPWEREDQRIWEMLDWPRKLLLADVEPGLWLSREVLLQSMPYPERKS